MRDNRSLEQKIKTVVRESSEKRNSEIRMKMSNVGRPTDGPSKLAKQGEIQRKIIDEDKDWEKDSAAVKASKDKKFVSKMIDKWGQRGGAWLNHPTLAPKPKEKTVKEDSEYGMARNELETAKRAIDRLNAKMGKGEGELEAWVQAKITKASDYLDTVADYIESGSVKEETIEEDSVASVSTKDTPKEQPESGKKKKDAGNEKDLMEPGTIKGGKTEVDLEPSTDDRDDDGKKISDKMKKATKEANAKAGVKEETMNTTKNFGLPADLIKTVEEALKGGQKKIDKNHNGKIDGQDFKILRGEKVKKEEVEELDEISLKTKINAYKAAADHDADYNYGSKVHAQADRLHNRIVAKHGRAAGDHANAAAYGKAPWGDRRDNPQKSDPLTKATSSTHKMRTTKSGVAHKQDQKANAAIIKSRLGKHGKSNLPEEVEQIDELSRKTLISYGVKADAQVHKVNALGMGTKVSGIPGHYRGKNKELGKDPAHKVRARKAGAELAWSKASKMKREEVELSAEELARIEEINNNLKQDTKVSK